ncbi:MAG: AAA family ATPase [Gammaproteobacteria bacterium]
MTETTSTLIDRLKNKSLYPHPVREFDVIETHISWVILTGEYAYKIKKSVDFGFLDFSTLEKRKHCCIEELRLNRRLAAPLYMDVITITGDEETPEISGAGPVIEYAVKMKQFEQSDQLDRMLLNGNLSTDLIDRVSVLIAAFHTEKAQPAPPESAFGSLEHVHHPVLENFSQLNSLLRDRGDLDRLERLQTWSNNEKNRLIKTFASRKEESCIRECHGDMHLANIAVFHKEIVIFDCIEFNPNLSWIDVISEAAFLFMDLDSHGRQDFAFRFLNHYLQQTGDYRGIELLRYYLCYRAMVRAKVECLRSIQQPDQPVKDVHINYRSYMKLAESYIQPARPAIIITHGLSGSGKTTITSLLMEHFNAIRIRSDIERKRMAGLSATESSQSGVAQDLYSRDNTQKTYDYLIHLSDLISSNGFNSIIDATFLKHNQREMFRLQAQRNNLAFVILNFQAPDEVLRQWITERQKQGDDASEANLKVLDHQQQTQEPLRADEMRHVLTIDTSTQVDLPHLCSELEQLIQTQLT